MAKLGTASEKGMLQICARVVVSSSFYVQPLPGEMIQFDEYFSTGLKPPTSDKIKGLDKV